MHNKTYIAIMGIVVAGITLISVIGVMLHFNGRLIKGVNKYENSATITTTIENESEKQTDITTTTKKVPIENKSDSTEEKQKTTTKSSAATTEETQTEIAETTTITTTITKEVATIETTIPITTTYKDNTYVETESDCSSLNEYNTEEYYVYSPYDLQTMGVISWGGYRYTYYSELVLPGYGLAIEGRHVDEYGFVCDVNGYICVASSSLPWGTVVDTPFGKQGKVYDSGGAWDVIDCYVHW